MDIQKIITTPLRVSLRNLVSSAMLALLFACLLAISGSGKQPPRFMLDQAQEAVSIVDGQSWRTASDWLAGRKYAVLTFDDGPYGHGVDDKILAVLHRHHAHAIFFLVCSHINDATSPLVSKFEREGNVVGNHSYDHLQLNRLQGPELRHQIEDCSSRIAHFTGHRPYYFRPPFGMTSSSVKLAAESSGMRQMLWNANSEDSWLTKPGQILYWSLEQTADRSILLLHDKPATADVLDQTLTNLEQRGFQFVLPTQPSSNSALD
jgi:peptidoglycan/xylan/chitin deacetylase (PgdA/CDA1 family)